MELKIAQFKRYRPKEPPIENPQEQPQEQGGLSWKDLFAIPAQAIWSGAPTRQEYLRRQYLKSMGKDPQKQYEYRNWLSKLLSGKPF